MTDATEAFHDLTQPDSPGEARRFAAVPLPEAPAHQLAKDEHGRPYLLVEATAATSRTRPAIALENVEIAPDVRCVITTPDGEVIERVVTLVGCTSDDALLHAYFLRAITAIAPTLGAAPTSEEVSRAVARLAEVFRLMREEPTRSVQGLWAELLVIARSRDPATLVAAWRDEPSDLFDFNAGAERLEVKSAVGHERVHEFRLEQLLAPEGTRVTITSVLVEPAGGGASVHDLVDDITTRIGSHPDLAEKLTRVVAQTLGREWRRAYDVTFDEEAAESSLKLFDAVLVPRVTPPDSPDVTHVRFRASLANLPELDAGSSGPLSAAARRARRRVPA